MCSPFCTIEFLHPLNAHWKQPLDGVWGWCRTALVSVLANVRVGLSFSAQECSIHLSNTDGASVFPVLSFISFSLKEVWS